VRLIDQFFDPGLCRRPLLLQRPQDDRLRDHQDLLGIGVVRADLRALVRVEKAFEQRAEDGRVDLAPVERGRGLQQADFVGFQRQCAAAVEQAAVEMGDLGQVIVSSDAGYQDSPLFNTAKIAAGARVAVGTLKRTVNRLDSFTTL
jgi:hypothetical protein